MEGSNQKEREDPRVQAMFKRSRHDILSIFIKSQGFYGLPKKTIRANGKIYNIIKPNNYRDRYFYQDKASIDMTLNDFNYLTPTFWDKKIATIYI